MLGKRKKVVKLVSRRQELGSPNQILMAKQMVIFSWLSLPLVAVQQHLTSAAPFSSCKRLLTASSASTSFAAATTHSQKKRNKENKRVEKGKEKRRTRSQNPYQEFDSSIYNNENHVPVLLHEVLDVFLMPLRSFVDCTLGAAGHSSAIIKSHPELQYFVGLDVDPVAHAMAQAQIDTLSSSHPHLKAHTILKNFTSIKSVLAEVEHSLLDSGVDAILMDLGMSSMQINNPERGFSVLADGPLDMRMDPQASLKAEDILNYWPEAEVGRILREYGEESNWRLLQNKIVQTRLCGGLHSTAELRDLIQRVTPGYRGGRQGWVKTAMRVFQALRIAVNDELNTLERSLDACFECLSPGGRLAVISFHSLEDRIVKQKFLRILESNTGEDGGGRDLRYARCDSGGEETWIRQVVVGQNGTILTKRPITPSEEEERLNQRCRSAKLRVIEKVRG